MYESSGAEYYDIFMKQFMQTLGQLGAAILTSTLAVPVYSYYTRNSLLLPKKECINEVYSTENEFNKNLNESDNITEKDITENKRKSNDDSDDSDDSDSLNDTE